MLTFTVMLYDWINESVIVKQVNAASEFDAIMDCKAIYPCTNVMQVCRTSAA